MRRVCHLPRRLEPGRAGADRPARPSGDLYARAGEFRKGLEVDLTLVRSRPEEPVFRYNLACSHSRLGDVDAALRALEAAVELGYQNADHIRRDRDLDNLRQDLRFIRLMERLDAAGSGS
ncbi:MAG: hypothetical protein JXA90_07615 [Planctomycetes bacterium]|nr:hypothetical protein [Planctomycetota bacterium]